jgi:hypothetical protein
MGKLEAQPAKPFGEKARPARGSRPNAPPSVGANHSRELGRDRASVLVAGNKDDLEVRAQVRQQFADDALGPSLLQEGILQGDGNACKASSTPLGASSYARVVERQRFSRIVQAWERGSRCAAWIRRRESQT